MGEVARPERKNERGWGRRVASGANDREESGKCDWQEKPKECSQRLNRRDLGKRHQSFQGKDAGPFFFLVQGSENYL